MVADLQVECRAVNSRFLDLGFRLPDECRGAEPALREMASQSLSRGKVEFRAAWRINSAAGNSAGEVKPIHTATLNNGRTALHGLCESRKNEGAALVAVLNKITSKMGEIVKVIEPRVPEYVAQYQEKLTVRLAEALASQEQAKGGAELMERIRQEVVLYAVRIDIAEEFARLKTHLQVVDTALGGKGPVGKRLDFLMQELNREANTLSSKSVSEECTAAALELKLLIEQMREQVQNLE